jgi:hypothetical protein
MFNRLGLWSVCFSIIGLSLFAQDAHAHDSHDKPQRFSLALDLDYSSSIDNSYVDQGGAFGLRIGSELDTFLVTLIPELNVNYHRFDGSPDDASVFAGLIGGRIRFLKIVEPGIFAHAGVGHVDGYDPHLGFAFDAGVTVDLTILPLVDIGLHVAWNRVFGDNDDDGLSYSTLGAHVALVL